MKNNEEKNPKLLFVLFYVLFITILMEASLAPSDHAVRDVVDVQKQVAITLYWLASSAEYRTIGNLFGVGKSTVYHMSKSQVNLHMCKFALVCKFLS
jgi:hypothetical protein